MHAPGGVVRACACARARVCVRVRGVGVGVGVVVVVVVGVCVCARAGVCLRLNFLFTPDLVEGVEMSGSVCGSGDVCLCSLSYSGLWGHCVLYVCVNASGHLFTG